MNNNSKIMIGAMAAAGVGVLVGLLFAPEKGSDLRKKILAEIDELGENMNKLVATAKSKVREFENDTRQLKRDIEQATDDTKTLIS